MAEAVQAPIHRISDAGVHEQLGTVDVAQGDGSVEIRVRLTGFPVGWHAMHVHEYPACGPALRDGAMAAGAAAGPHFDPTGAMAAMAGMVHMPVMAGPRDGKAMDAAEPVPPGRTPRPLGDLPAVYTDADGTTDMRILSYRLDLDQLRGRALVLHEFPEGSDDPRMAKDGGDKIACAVLPE